MQKTTDLWFTTFLRLKGYEIKDFQSTNNRGVFFFDIEESLWKELKLDFPKSEVSKAKYIQEELKDMVH